MGAFAQLEVRGPHGEHWVVELDPHRVIHVGRPVLDERPDVALEPDPQKWISRLHCFIEHEVGGWWLCDNDTINGTLLSRGQNAERIVGRVQLVNGDIIRILGGLDDDDAPIYWELGFSDPFETDFAGIGNRDVRASPGAICDHVEYDWVQAKLYRVVDGAREEVGTLSPQAHKLIRYMANRSRHNGGSPVACTHAELIAAVWADGDDSVPYGYTEQNLRDLVLDVRKRLEPDRKKGEPPRLLETVPGIGYRLIAGPAS